MEFRHLSGNISFHTYPHLYIFFFIIDFWEKHFGLMRTKRWRARCSTTKSLQPNCALDKWRYREQGRRLLKYKHLGTHGPVRCFVCVWLFKCVCVPSNPILLNLYPPCNPCLSSTAYLSFTLSPIIINTRPLSCLFSLHLCFGQACMLIPSCNY